LRNGTINREVAVLKKALRLAYEHGKLMRLPVIHMLKEAAPRQGFFERDQFEAVRRKLQGRARSPGRGDDRVRLWLAHAVGDPASPAPAGRPRGADAEALTRDHEPRNRAARSISRPSSSGSSESSSPGSMASSGGRAGSSRPRSRTSSASRADRSETLGGPGRRRAGARAARGCCGTTSAGPPCGTW
jgi:hypothetical protein